MAIEMKINSLEIVSMLNATLSVKVADKSNLSLLEGKDFNDYTMILKKKKEKSQNINNYLWILCDKIASKISLSKDDVYRQAVREVGIWFDVSVKAGEEEDLIRSWQQNGIGWFAEQGFASREFTNMRLYKGSSVYDSEEMRRLVDYIVDEAKGLGIETMTPLELERLQNLWKG